MTLKTVASSSRYFCQVSDEEEEEEEFRNQNARNELTRTEAALGKQKRNAPLTANRPEMSSHDDDDSDTGGVVSTFFGSRTRRPRPRARKVA